MNLSYLAETLTTGSIDMAPVALGGGSYLTLSKQRKKLRKKIIEAYNARKDSKFINQHDSEEYEIISNYIFNLKPNAWYFGYIDPANGSVLYTRKSHGHIFVADYLKEQGIDINTRVRFCLTPVDQSNAHYFGIKEFGTMLQLSAINIPLINACKRWIPSNVVYLAYDIYGSSVYKDIIGKQEVNKFRNS